jgi:hypothetical protein
MISPRLAQERVSLAYEQSMAKLQEEAEAAEAELKKKLEQFARNHARGEIENEKDVVDSVPVLDTTISSEKKISFPGNAATRARITKLRVVVVSSYSITPIPHRHMIIIDYYTSWIELLNDSFL